MNEKKDDVTFNAPERYREPQCSGILFEGLIWGVREREKPAEIALQWKPYVIYDRVRRCQALS